MNDPQDPISAPTEATPIPAAATAAAAAPVDDSAAPAPEAAEGAQQPSQDDAPARRRRRGGRGRGRGAAPAAAPGDDAATPAPAGPESDANGDAPKDKSKARAGKTAERRGPHPVLERLFQLYPALFGARFLPLKRGVYEDLVARHGSEFEPEALKAAMGLHARSTRYLECVAAGLPRHDLEGQVVEPMAPEHVHHALMEVYKRRRQRGGRDVTEELRTRLVKAIEASGLAREDYQQRMRTRDEASNAMLDEAVAELGRQAARREALLRAFEASGKTEAEFADMYGLGPKDAARQLAQARRERTPAAAATATAPEATGA